MANCGADTEANRLLPVLTGDADFTIPTADLSGITFPDDALNTPVTPLTIQDVTNGLVDGPGAFDHLMRGFKAHLQEEFDAQRITGDDYTKAYIALTDSAMGQSIAFLMGKDQAFWQSQMIQVQAFSERVRLEIAKVELVATQFNASNQKASYALTKMNVANAEIAYCTGKYNLEQMLPQQLLMSQSQVAGQEIENEAASYNLNQMLPQQKAMLVAQTTQTTVETDASRFNVNTMLPLQRDMLTSQKTGQDTANSTATYNLQQMLPAQLALLQDQQLMVTEQTNAQRAQTMDNRLDGAAVNGVLGKQKELYSQQITSYKRDSELKVAKIFADSWTVQKTIDEGLTAPNSFTNVEIEKVMVDLRAKAQLGV